MKTIKNSRIQLWAHLVSEHAMCVGLNYPMREYEEIHKHEHNGPGGLRFHPEESRRFSFKKIGEVLSDSDGTDFDNESPPVDGEDE